MENAGTHAGLEDRGASASARAIAAAIAKSFVTARREARPLAEFPGTIPPNLAAAYLCQSLAIDSWPDRLIGWKIGMVPPPLRLKYASDRLAGAIFERGLRAAGGENSFPVFVGGFAAVEAEFVLRIVHDAPAGKLDWTEREARALVGAMHIGIETAGSPLSTINELGPTVVAADFGNNAGIILGPEIRDWAAQPLDALAVATSIEGRIVGRGGAGRLPGGPIAALQFLAGQAATMGWPLKAGMLVSTGAVTGVHDIEAGQRAVADFGAYGKICCLAVAAVPWLPE